LENLEAFGVLLDIALGLFVLVFVTAAHPVF
jgi:hypothetical protein